MMILVLLLSFVFSMPLYGQLHILHNPIDKHTTNIQITIPVAQDEVLYRDFLSTWVDHHDLEIRSSACSQQATNHYDSSFKENKRVFQSDVTLDLEIIKKSDQPINHALLHIAYIKNSSSGPQEETIPITFKEILPEQQPNVGSTQPEAVPSLPQDQDQSSSSWFDYLSTLFKTTQSLWIQLLLAFLFGLLFSLTPCIYPMIPITAGILQSQGSNSILRNTLSSFAYTCGMATTFALFGLLASCVGPLCGQLLMQPLFILGLISILAYLAFSMIGLYEMYIPSFLKKQQTFKGGSLLAVFLFGAASGTIASPCVSPGLALILTVVATMGNQLQGFLLLFLFGIGLSIPLLLVGMFSSSLQILPQAGMWMIEVKRLLGFCMLGMCFYYASYVLPATPLLWILAASLVLFGIYYLYLAQKNYAPLWQKFNYLIGIFMIASALPISFYALKQQFKSEVCEIDTLWQTNYECARQQALQENKYLFIDFWATFCPVCIAINKQVLVDPIITKELEYFVNLKVDGSYNSNVPYNELKDIYSITGFPVFLIIDPESGNVITRMGSEIYDIDREELARLLHRHSRK